MLSSLAFLFSVGSCSSEGESGDPLKAPDCGREMGVSVMLGGEGLLSDEEGDVFGRENELMLWGFTPSGGISKGLGVLPIEVGNCR